MKKFSLIIILLIIYGCGSSNISEQNNAAESFKLIKSNYSSLSFEVPSDFIQIKKESNSFFDLCVVDKNYSTAAYLVPFIIDFPEKNGNQNFQSIVNMSIVLKESEYLTEIDKEAIEYFQSGENQIAQYSFSDNFGCEVDVFLIDHSAGYQELTLRVINQNRNSNIKKFDPVIKDLILNSLK